MIPRAGMQFAFDDTMETKRHMTLSRVVRVRVGRIARDCKLKLVSVVVHGSDKKEIAARVPWWGAYYNVSYLCSTGLFILSILSACLK